MVKLKDMEQPMMLKKMKYEGEFKNRIYNMYIVIEYSDGSLFEGEIIYIKKKLLEFLNMEMVINIRENLMKNY